MTYTKPRHWDEKIRLKKLIKVKEWGKTLEKGGGCISPDGHYEYLANVTWGGLDFCAGGRTGGEAINNLYNHIVE